MSYYSNEVARLNKKHYPHDDLTKKIMKAKLYIDKHFSENIDLDKVASQAHVSKFHFIRVFKKYYGCTPNQCLQDVRIKKAKQLLQQGSSIEEACMTVGFSSKTSFAGLFKKLTGYTPLVYKNKKQF